MIPFHAGWLHGLARALVVATTIALFPIAAMAQIDTTLAREDVKVVRDSNGFRLQVDGRDFMVRGMNWDYTPIGQNYTFNLWDQSEDMIIEALDREMSLMRDMGVNAIRVYTGIPPRWVRWIRERYGIYCIVNHTVGRYGFTLDGVWNPSVDYSNPRMRAAIAADVASMVQQYRGCRGVLMYLMGNENNYGLSWSSFEIEALPKGERETVRARFLYSLFEEVAAATKAGDPGIPVAMANGDVQYLELIASECKSYDVFGTNVYRGISARDLFVRVRDVMGLPVMFTEFGCDAFSAKNMCEDQAFQARYLIGQWQEIYDQSAGHGGAGNAIGGCVFQWSDGWWKHKQTERLDIQDTDATWPNGGYPEDLVPGENNMNEEWWGICAKGRPDGRMLYDLYPRAAFYALRKIFSIDPYAQGASRSTMAAEFAGITPGAAALEARSQTGALAAGKSDRARITGVRLNFETISAGGRLRNSVPLEQGGRAGRPADGFDRFQSFFVDVEGNPAPTVSGRLSLNARGNVPTNPIDAIFYENRSPDRVKVYRSAMRWNERWFDLDAFYRTGHFHWGFEGDFFGLYREANYGPNVDTYDAETPVGVEVAGRKSLTGLKAALGPQLWWGAAPAALVKYRRALGRLDATAMYQRDFGGVNSSEVVVINGSATVVKPTQKATVHVKTSRGSVTMEAGGIWAGDSFRDDAFPTHEGSGDSYRLLRDYVRGSDTFGFKMRLSGARGPALWYLQGASMGLVAEGGPTATNNYMDWRLKDTGLGNQRNVIGGFAYAIGRFQVGPNVLWQKPIVPPLPNDPRNQGVQRNLTRDPFIVRGNREMTGYELLFSYDPTPATWLYAWDNDIREDARFAGSIGFQYRQMPTSMDPAIGLLADGVTPFIFDGATPARDLWEIHARAVSRASPSVRAVVHAWYGLAEPSQTPDPRLVRRKGFDTQVAVARTVFSAFAKFDDFGPYDFYRDFNLTYPVQLMGDLSLSLGSPQWLDAPSQTRVGVRTLWRSLDRYSLRYSGLPDDPNGSEWEIRTYVRLGI